MCTLFRNAYFIAKENLPMDKFQSLNDLNKFNGAVITSKLYQENNACSEFIQTISDSIEQEIRCELSGHEMPCRLDALESYIKGKKFEKLLEKHNYQYEKQHLTKSIKKSRSHQLFCTLTYRHLNNTPQHIQKHLDGRRFKKVLLRCKLFKLFENQL
ncbi:unnamed protein product [Mytilus edulis]|uniref:Uncharacterized protein n=1 Tax=Mytilus edulis TaxID=6550 RepID=A0A8S3VM25_MYTED|nr:unnamed protein product [Mytilus edulis]